MGADRTPYAGLTPEVVLDALDAVGYRGDGRLVALNSYENRVYLVYLEDGGSLVAKFYRPGRWSDEQIAEEHALLAELAQEEVPAVAPLPLAALSPSTGQTGAAGTRATILAGGCLARWGDFRFALFPRRGGRAPELDRPGVLAWIGRFIARIHAVGARRRFVTRPSVDPQSLGEVARRAVLESGLLPPACEGAWLRAVDQVLALVRARFASLPGLGIIRLHGDCHPGNVLWTDEGPHFVDFDDARNGPAVQDLWMLLSGDRESQEVQLAAVLEGYETFREFDRVELLLVEALRTLRLMHYAAWVARRWDDPAFPASFTWFGTQRYWEEHILALREQVAAMDEPALSVP